MTELQMIEKTLELVKEFGWGVGSLLSAGLVALKFHKPIRKWFADRAETAELAKFAARLAAGLKLAEEAYDFVENMRRNQARSGSGVDPDRAPANGIALPLKPTRGQLRAAAMKYAKKLLPAGSPLEKWTDEEWLSTIDHVHEKRRAAEQAAGLSIRDSATEIAFQMRKLQKTIESGAARQKALGWEKSGEFDPPPHETETTKFAPLGDTGDGG